MMLDFRIGRDVYFREVEEPKPVQDKWVNS
jgi:hypothetical protein